MNNANLIMHVNQTMSGLKVTHVPRRKGVALKYPNAKVTGNLKFNATKFTRIDGKIFKVYVDETVAPYMPYTNEPWISPRWKGTKNPNENWFNEMFDELAVKLARRLKGKLRRID